MRSAILLATVFFFTCGSLFGIPNEMGPWEWRFVAGGPQEGWPAVDGNGRVYFTSEDRFLYALSADGVMSWRTDLRRRSSGMVSVGPDGSVYVVLQDGRLIAINKDGRLLWENRLERGEQLPPVVTATGMVICSDTTGRVEAFTHRGAAVWSVDVGERIACAPVMDLRGLLVFATVSGNVITVHPSGRVVGRRYLGAVAAALAPYEGGVLAGTASGYLIRLPDEGDAAWRVDLGSAVAQVSLETIEDIYVLTDEGAAVRVTGDGVVTWRANPVPAYVTGLAVVDGALMTVSGGSVAHIAADGGLSWQTRISGAPLGIALSGTGMALVASDNWVTYAHPLEADISGAWPLVRGGPGATGVSPGMVAGRPGSASEVSLDAIYLSEFLRSPHVEDQVAGLNEIAQRAEAAGASSNSEGGDLSGAYGYILDLCEEVAGAPYYGPVGSDGRTTTAAQSRLLALSILGEIGDLYTSRFLLRLLRVEERVDMQAEILVTLGRLGSGLDGGVEGALHTVIRSDVARGGTNRLALAGVECLSGIFEYEGGFLTADGVHALMTIAAGPYLESTRTAAEQTLRSLATER